MSQRPIRPRQLRSSRERYREFVEDYKHKRVDDSTDENSESKGNNGAPKTDGAATEPQNGKERRSKRRQYLRDYLRWLLPHRYAVSVLMVLALAGAGLEMVEPLFMRFMVDRVLL